ncbi:MAG: hypothetical protein MJZ29_05220 [Bacteroidaceae bacterium]|nr:hypothetical protein [Bacteroidaceae bacterium]
MKKFFMMIAAVAMAAVISSCGDKTAQGGNADSAQAETAEVEAEAAAPASDKPMQEQMKDAIATLKEACEKKDQDMLEKGMDAYLAALGSAKSMDDLQEMEKPEYDLVKAMSGSNNPEEWADMERFKKYEGAIEKTLEDVMKKIIPGLAEKAAEAEEIGEALEGTEE